MQHWGDQGEGADPKPSTGEWLARIVSAIVMAAYIAGLVAPFSRALLR